MRVQHLLRDLTARIVRVREGLADGDVSFAEEVAADLELDLAALVACLTHVRPRDVEWPKAA